MRGHFERHEVPPGHPRSHGPHATQRGSLPNRHLARISARHGAPPGAKMLTGPPRTAMTGFAHIFL